jgi:hypothetical protein
MTHLLKDFRFQFAVFAIAVIGFFSFMQFVPSAGFSDPDGYYHAAAARLIAAGKLHASFPWAYFSTLRDHYGDQHFLFHLLMIPLSSLKGMHLSVVFFSSLMVFAFVWLLRRLGVKYPLLWGGFLVVSSIDFLFRINVVKANTLSLILLFGTVWLLVSKRHRWLVPLSALFVWTYGGFVFLPLVGGAYVAAKLIGERKLNLWPLVYILLGIGVGLLLHPHFPNLAVHLYYQLFDSGISAGLKVPVGSEWYPYSVNDLVSANGLNLLAFLASTAVLAVEFTKVKKEQTDATNAAFLWFTTLGFLALMIRSRRFVEYSVPFNVLFSSYVVTKVVNPEFWDTFKEALRYWHMRFFTVLLIWVLVLIGAFNVTRVEGWLAASTEAEALKGAGDWLSANTKPGEIIFNTKWDDLPQLMYFDPNNYYIIGLDPTFMYAYDQELYRKWRQVADNDPLKFGNSYTDMRDIVNKDFKSHYVVLENARDGKLKYFLDAHRSEGASEVYEDEFSAIYEIN